MELLALSGEQAAFSNEIGDMIAAVCGHRVRVHLVEEVGLTRNGASVSALHNDMTEVDRKRVVAVSHSNEERTPGPVPRQLEQPQPGGAALELHCVGKRYALIGVVLIGRSSSCDINVADSEMSRKHAEISVRDSLLVVRDLGSTNGTKVNGTVIDTPTILTAGDVITVGTTEISVVTAS